MSRLVETRKSKAHHLIDRLICLISTFLIFMTTIESIFSIMKVVKTRLGNTMDDEIYFKHDNNTQSFYNDWAVTRGGTPASIVPSNICITLFIVGRRIGSGLTHHNPTIAILSNLLKSPSTSGSCFTTTSSFPNLRQFSTQSVRMRSSSSVSSSIRSNSMCLLQHIISSSITPKLWTVGIFMCGLT